MKNPLLKWLDRYIYGHTFSFAGISATAVAAGVSAAATAATAASSLMAGDEAEKGAIASDAANAQLTAEQIKLAGQARDRANAYQSPYYSQGMAGQNKLAYLLGTSNVTETPTDTSYDAFRTTITNRKNEAQIALQQLKAQRPKPQNKKAFAQWKTNKAKLENQLKNISGTLKGDSTSVQYQKWKEKMPGTVKTELPKDASYGSLLTDFGEKWQDPEFKFEADPGYQFRKEQGQRELDRRLAGMGMASSGAALKEGARFNQGLAEQGYQDAFNRFQTERGFDYGRFQDRYNQFNTDKTNKFNMLTSQAQAGQESANNLSQNENIYGSNVTGAKASQNQARQANIADRANARSARLIAAGNAIGQGANNFVGYLGNREGIQSTAAAKQKPIAVNKSKILAGRR